MRGKLEVTLNNDHSEIAKFSRALAAFGQRYRLAPRLVQALDLALEEILTNIMSHGYTDDAGHEIKVRLTARPEALEAEVEDGGQPFNPLKAPAPDTTRSLHDRSIGGLGIHLARNLVDSLEYERREGKNVLRLRKSVH
jgi:anti-sigma regulatory factor (Ser/Thr protein kinase)